MTARTKRGHKHDLYLELIIRFPLRPIRADGELDRAVEVIDSLIDREQLEPEEKDYLEVLSDLVERYETENRPIPRLSDAEIVKHLIATKGVTQAVVARETRIAESTISDLVAGKRKLNRTHISKLARYFGVEPGAFTFDA